MLMCGVAIPAWSLAAGDAVNGERLYEIRCTGCHSLDANRVGLARDRTDLIRFLFRESGVTPAQGR